MEPARTAHQPQGAVLPEGLDAWCAAALGARPVEVLMASRRVSQVFAVRLADDREVVVKARDQPVARAATCVEVQRRLADAGFPAARPLTAVDAVRGLAVHAEEHRPGGELVADDGTAAARRSARLHARSLALTAPMDLPAPLPAPEWVGWEHAGPGPFPPNPRWDARQADVGLPRHLVELAERARARLSGARLPQVVGHADWEAQNLRWSGEDPCVVHDWDSLALAPAAALAGAAAGAFASAHASTLAPVASSAAFLDAWQEAWHGEGGRAFTPEEVRVAWAASLWPALHNARIELLFDLPPVSATAVGEQAEERLALAGA